MQKSLPNIIASVVFLILGAFWLIVAFSMPGSSGSNVFGNSRTFPQIVSIIIIIVSIIQLVCQVTAAVKSGSKEDKDNDNSVVTPKQTYVNIIILIVLIALYCLIVNFLTYLPATILLLGAAMWIFGVRNKGIFILVATLFPVLLLVVFRYLLEVPLP